DFASQRSCEKGDGDMRWKGRRGSTNVQDRRGAGVGLVGGGIGAVILTILALVLGVDPGTVVQAPSSTAPPSAAEDSLVQFVSVVLADTEEVWEQIFREELGQQYLVPDLVIFSGAVQSACGFAQAAVGPFYCPLDQDVYLDLSFFADLHAHLGAPGDFAQAYVIAHEVGHHVQTLLGISQQVHAARGSGPEAEANALSVRLELQADCFAGVWANRAHQEWQILEPGDIEEALAAASAVGDDRLQSATRGEVVPESFTHGTSAERMQWFDRGFRAGTPAECDTCAAADI
ncbi:MAG TPA: neutral zinc metallopeptidase, partial [Longimicrobiaceae bacterium]|nr:neutral zinc metallopeptidase [Longimicrobiaceae bacterium]